MITTHGQLALDLAAPRRPSRARVSYFNTSHLAGRDLTEAVRSAKHQDILVLTIFRGFTRPLTPSEVWRMGHGNGSDWLLTSVRRSINTLTKEGLLVKCSGHKISPYNRPERLWRLKENEHA